MATSCKIISDSGGRSSRDGGAKLFAIGFGAAKGDGSGKILAPAAGIL